jgi:hypothetical protein
MALMAPAMLLIVVMHSWTTGRLPLYFLPTEGEIFKPICASLEYDLLYSAAFISFFLVMLLALAARIGEAVARDPSKGPDSPSVWLMSAVCILIFFKVGGAVFGDASGSGFLVIFALPIDWFKVCAIWTD